MACCEDILCEWFCQRWTSMSDCLLTRMRGRFALQPTKDLTALQASLFWTVSTLTTATAGNSVWNHGHSIGRGCIRVDYGFPNTTN